MGFRILPGGLGLNGVKCGRTLQATRAYWPEEKEKAKAVDMSDPSRQCRLRSGPYLGEISALCFLHLSPEDNRLLSSFPYLLAGTGSQLLLYDLETGKMVESFQVFQGIRVHGITSTSSLIHHPNLFRIAVFGERRVKLFTLSIQNKSSPHLTLFQLLPKFSHWIMDVCFLKNSTNSLSQEDHCIAIGCSDNSVSFWDSMESRVTFEANYPDRCLLYCMRVWGDTVEALRIASGTIYNEIIVWKVLPQNLTSSGSTLRNNLNLVCSSEIVSQLHEQHKVVCLCRLVGHEGSIFRIAWSADGSSLLSVSDDRSARLWKVNAEEDISDGSKGIHDSHSVGPVLYGHNARVWDCFISDSVIVTAGEDCTCRVWTLEGTQLLMIKEHIGRGIWRCLYDQKSSILVTAGFDSALKTQQLHASLPESPKELFQKVKDVAAHSKKVFSICIPRSLGKTGLMDRSEYVRCLRFAREDTLYVATNNGYLYHVKLSNTGDVQWTQLVRVSDVVPIVCLDLLCRSSSNCTSTNEDWIAVGDGKGYMTVVGVIDDIPTPIVSVTISWLAGAERQLLGAYWCKSLGNRIIFTSDPRGMLSLWRLHDSSLNVPGSSVRGQNASLVAEFVSCFGIRLMCLDASLEEEVLICGDLRGNLVLFPLSKDVILGTSVASEVKISTLSYFKGTHGISSVCSVSVAYSSFSQVEILTTGGDGCICNLEYNRESKSLDFIGMKHVKELSLIRCISDLTSSETSVSYAVGFSSSNFFIWNLMTETKAVQIPCGGWRRPYSYYLGDVPEMNYCFAFVKDEKICIHCYSVPKSERKIYPENLHLQFHGREMHSICFISEFQQQGGSSESCWIATGSEDGTVRLNRYDQCVCKWSASKLLGEHVGGSAVRSICFISKTYKFDEDTTTLPDFALEEGEDPCLLISVGAKRVLTCWKQKMRVTSSSEKLVSLNADDANRSDFTPPSDISSSISFQWLSTDMPLKNRSGRETRRKNEKVGATENNFCSNASDVPPLEENSNVNLKSVLRDIGENDWRYLAVTAFLLKVSRLRLTVCFVIVACSDATLTLRALLLPCRLWFDVASLGPLSSPILALQHIVVPMSLYSEDNTQSGSMYIVVSGSTDGSIMFWDLTETVEKFIYSVSTCELDKSVDSKRRPRTGRGSQGGRWWKSLGSGCSRNNLVDENSSMLETNSDAASDHHPGRDGTGGGMNLLPEIFPLKVFKNVHQSGVNCIHISSRHDTGCVYYVLSGGDDQAIHCLGIDLEILASNPCCTVDKEKKQKLKMSLLCNDAVASAHSSAVKGIWTDGHWVFSTGVDQRIRCWDVDGNGKLRERACLIISVPEPEALDARACGKGVYQIAVAGRGMQMVDFTC